MKAGGGMGVTVLLLGLLLAGGLTMAQAATYLGEFCWQGSEGGVARFAVTDMGGGHFLLNGRVVHVDPGHSVSALLGNAEVVGNKVYLSFAGTEADASRTQGVFARGVLDLPGLDGTVESLQIRHEYSNPNPSNAQVSYEGPQALTFIPCP